MAICASICSFPWRKVAKDGAVLEVSLCSGSVGHGGTGVRSSG